MAVTRTEAICRAILEELRRRRSLIDECDDLSSVSITVKLQDTAEPVRAVHYEEQRMVAQRRPDLRSHPAADGVR